MVDKTVVVNGLVHDFVNTKNGFTAYRAVTRVGLFDEVLGEVVLDIDGVVVSDDIDSFFRGLD